MRCRILSVSLFAVLGGVSIAAQQSAAFPPPGPPPLFDPGTSDLAPVLPDPSNRVMRASFQSGGAPAQPDPQQSAQDGFVPVSQLPPEEQLPAAPMLVSAYVVVVLALFLYLLSLSRRLGTVKQEIARLDAEVRRSGRA
jgi:CcmD family protein